MMTTTDAQTPKDTTEADSLEGVSCAAASGYAPEYPPKISVFASFPGEEYFQRRHERYATRKEAAAGIRDARAKGGFDINVLDPWSKKREAHNDKFRDTAGT